MNVVETCTDQWKREWPDPEPVGVIGQLNRAGGLLSGSIRNSLRGVGMEPGEFDVLATLRRIGPPHTLSPTQLVETTMVGAAVMTRRVDKLLERGLVSRSVDPENRRRLRITLTPAGRSLIDAVIPGHIDNADRFLNALSGPERKTLSGLLRKVLVSHGDTHP